jgi:adenine C2-methylase RlmN of 23S rRNA A2503 and tRNA A37
VVAVSLVSSTVRKRKGADISAACGQLRREALVENATQPLEQVSN